MSRAVMISIRPKWCEMIAAGRKTIEVRKTKPNLVPPFKAYIYCTKRKREEEVSVIPVPGSFGEKFRTIAGGCVIGEFVCDSIFPLSFYASDASFFDTEPPFPVPGTCLTDKEIAEYLGNGKTGYGWHISDLKIYDRPKYLTEFIGLTKTRFGYAERVLRHPPQSFFYVEKLL